MAKVPFPHGPWKYCLEIFVNLQMCSVLLALKLILFEINSPGWSAQCTLIPKRNWKCWISFLLCHVVVHAGYCITRHSHCQHEQVLTSKVNVETKGKQKRASAVQSLQPLTIVGFTGTTASQRVVSFNFWFSVRNPGSRSNFPKSILTTKILSSKNTHKCKKVK